ncbi:uncharacterized protein LOC114523279 [Dendronephthya gigantea]|uniref:uncharacterized protein LOC114523279 n=1 Tax=Dendronephthya gigantea TaxID=151771 RepID=UPI00106B340C|nr:uncharacterized protein LOC114523279 [Dendronephthya gigantea]
MVKNSLISCRRLDLEVELEMIVVEIELADAPNVIFATFYRPPECSLNFVSGFSSFLQKVDILHSNNKIVILGDFNFPTINWSSPCFTSPTSDESLFCETLYDYFLTQVVACPTRPSSAGSSDGNILDLIITNFPEHVINLDILPPNETQFRTDHSLLVFDFTVKPQLLAKTSRMVYSYKNADFLALRDTLRNTTFDDPVDGVSGIDLAWQRWYDLFTSAVDRHVPKRKIRGGSPPWIDGEVMHLLRQKKTARRKALSRGKDSSCWEKFRHLRRLVKSTIRKKHSIYIQSLQTSLKDNPKRFWSYLKSRTRSGSIPNIVKLDEHYYRNPKEKSEAFNDYFFSSFTSTNSDELFLPDVDVGPDSSFTELVLDTIVLTSEEVATILHKLDTNKAHGPDGIPARLLKECADEIAPSLCSLFNLSLQTGYLPLQWKLAHVVPVHKKGSKEMISNYRPISLLCIVSKVLERCVFSRLIAHLAPQLHNAQHGFLSGR